VSIDEKIDRVRQIVADTLFLTLDDVDENATQESLKNWDSIQHLNVVLALEQAFQVRFPPEDFQTMISVKTIVENLEEKSV